MRVRTSAAAARLNVRMRTGSGGPPGAAEAGGSASARRRRTSVLPAPAPATMASGRPGGLSTAACWAFVRRFMPWGRERREGRGTAVERGGVGRWSRRRTRYCAQQASSLDTAKYCAIGFPRAVGCMNSLVASELTGCQTDAAARILHAIQTCRIGGLPPGGDPSAQPPRSIVDQSLWSTGSCTRHRHPTWSTSSFIACSLAACCYPLRCVPAALGCFDQPRPALPALRASCIVVPCPSWRATRPPPSDLPPPHPLLW